MGNKQVLWLPSKDRDPSPKRPLSHGCETVNFSVRKEEGSGTHWPAQIERRDEKGESCVAGQDAEFLSHSVVLVSD